MLPQQFERVGNIPGRMPHLHNQRILRKSLQHLGKIRDRFRLAMKRKRELHQQRPQLVALRKTSNPARASRSSAAVASCSCVNFFHSFAVNKKSRVRRHPLDPLRGVIRLHRVIKRSIDLDGVKIFCQKRSRMKVFRPRLRINISRPIRISPSRRPNVQHRRQKPPLQFSPGSFPFEN